MPQEIPQHGPFTEELTKPRFTLDQAAMSHPGIGMMGAGGNAALLVSRFLEGVSRGRRQNFEQQELQKAKDYERMLRLSEYISAAPLTSSAKQEATGLLRQGILQQGASEMAQAGGKQNIFSKAISALVGNQSGKYDQKQSFDLMKSVMDIALDKKNALDPTGFAEKYRAEAQRLIDQERGAAAVAKTIPSSDSVLSGLEALRQAGKKEGYDTDSMDKSVSMMLRGGGFAPTPQAGTPESITAPSIYGIAQGMARGGAPEIQNPLLQSGRQFFGAGQAFQQPPSPPQGVAPLFDPSRAVSGMLHKAFGITDPNDPANWETIRGQSRDGKKVTVSRNRITGRENIIGEEYESQASKWFQVEGAKSDGKPGVFLVNRETQEVRPVPLDKPIPVEYRSRPLTDQEAESFNLPPGSVIEEAVPRQYVRPTATGVSQPPAPPSSAGVTGAPVRRAEGAPTVARSGDAPTAEDNPYAPRVPAGTRIKSLPPTIPEQTFDGFFSGQYGLSHMTNLGISVRDRSRLISELGKRGGIVLTNEQVVGGGQLGKMETAKKMFEEVNDLLKKAGWKAATGIVLAPEVKEAMERAMVFIGQLARGISEERGVLTQKDIERAKGYTPSTLYTLRDQNLNDKRIAEFGKLIAEIEQREYGHLSNEQRSAFRGRYNILHGSQLADKGSPVVDKAPPSADKDGWPVLR